MIWPPKRHQRDKKKEDAALQGLRQPSPTDIVRVISGIGLAAFEQPDEELRELMDQVYMFAHIGDRPTCLHAHRDWVVKFWEAEAAMVKLGFCRGAGRRR